MEARESKQFAKSLSWDVVERGFEPEPFSTLGQMLFTTASHQGLLNLEPGEITVSAEW